MGPDAWNSFSNKIQTVNNLWLPYSLPGCSSGGRKCCSKQKFCKVQSYPSVQSSAIWRYLNRFQTTMMTSSLSEDRVNLYTPVEDEDDTQVMSVTEVTAWLTHWGRIKMVTISQTKFSSAFSWMKTIEFQHWNTFLWVWLINMAALVQIMARRRTGDRPLSEAKLICCADAYIHHSASVSFKYALVVLRSAISCVQVINSLIWVTENAVGSDTNLSLNDHFAAEWIASVLWPAELDGKCP